MTDNKEIWKDVPDPPYNKTFAVSNFGRIKNKNTDNIKALTSSKVGFQSIRLDLGKTIPKKTYQIHQLVAKMFIG